MKNFAHTILLLIILLLMAHASWVIWSSVRSQLIIFNRPTLVRGVVVGLPEYQKRQARFIIKANGNKRIRLTWYGRYPWLHPGETWQLTIKSSHNLLHATSGFNYANWLKWHGFDSAAYVVSRGDNKRLKRAKWYQQPINTLRYELRWQLVKATRHLPFRDILIALSMGDRSYLTQQRWQTFIHTGTSHLIAISGLHVGLLAGVVFFLLRWLLGSIPCLTNRIPAQHAAMIGATLTAGFYSILAGLAVTTIRAFLMLLVVAIGMLSRRKLSLLSGWLLALAAIFLMMPGQFSSAGAWLSFGAVFWLYYTFAGRVGHMPKHFAWWYPQWTIFIGLAPLVIYWFHTWSFVSLTANFVAIPVVSFIVLPLALLGSLLAYPLLHFAHDIFWLANMILSWLWWYLYWLASQSWWGMQFKPLSAWRCVLASFGAFWFLAPRAVPARWVGVILFLCLFFG